MIMFNLPLHMLNKNKMPPKNTSWSPPKLVDERKSNKYFDAVVVSISIHPFSDSKINFDHLFQNYYTNTDNHNINIKWREYGQIIVKLSKI